MADEQLPPSVTVTGDPISLDEFAARGVLVPANASALEVEMTLALFGEVAVFIPHSEKGKQ